MDEIGISRNYHSRNKESESQLKQTPLNSYLNLKSIERSQDSSSKNKIFQPPNHRVNNRYMRKRNNPDSASQKSSNQKFCLMESNNSEIPMSYRVINDESLTPYSNSHMKNQQNKGKTPQSLLREQARKKTTMRVSTSQSKTRPMSYTFHNPSNNPSQ